MIYEHIRNSYYLSFSGVQNNQTYDYRLGGNEFINYNPNFIKKDYVKSNLNKKLLKRMGIIECKTCKNRKYKDISNDPGVSFKTPQNVSPQMSASAVLAHEKEHEIREKQRAKDKGYEVISSSIKLELSICPECGRVYVSGGETTTILRKVNENRENKTDPFTNGYNKAILSNFGIILDLVI